MAVTITVDDFVNEFELSINDFTEGKLQSYIDEGQLLVLNKLFGVDLYELWNSDGSNPIYSYLTNPFIYQDSNSCTYESKGIKFMLMGLIYWEYCRDIATKQTIDGSVIQLAENSKKATFVSANLHKRYNNSILTYEAIQGYIMDNIDVYPDFNGEYMGVVIPYF